MSKMGNYYIEQMEKKFGGVPTCQDQICNVCHKPYWQHKGCVCPTDNSMDEPE